MLMSHFMNGIYNKTVQDGVRLSLMSGDVISLVQA